MKILYVSNSEKNYRTHGVLNDYLNDLLFYSLYVNPDVDITDSTRISHMYISEKYNVCENKLWGKGFTSCFLIENDSKINRDNIEEKIRNKYYDYIIYGSIWRCEDYYELVSSCYANNKIIIVDGEDKTDISNFVEKHLYFKRELIYEYKNLVPIHFAIPDIKICRHKPQKSQQFAKSIPYLNTNNSYIFNNEKDYYCDYQKSEYAITMKKAGWDCMRHYEIISNYCMPLFLNIEQLPKTTMTNFDRNLLKKCNQSFLDENLYQETLEEIYDYLVNNLTTTKLSQYFLESIVQ